MHSVSTWGKKAIKRVLKPAIVQLLVAVAVELREERPLVAAVTLPKCQPPMREPSYVCGACEVKAPDAPEQCKQDGAHVEQDWDRGNRDFCRCVGHLVDVVDLRRSLDLRTSDA